jgi:hypothetical protein
MAAQSHNHVMTDDQAHVQARLATADHAPEFVLSNADFARAILDIITEADAALEEAGAEKLSSVRSLGYYVSQLGKSLVDVDAGSNSWDARQLESNIARVELGLAQWLESEAAAASEAITGGVRSRLETWHLLRRPPDALVDFDALLGEVMKNDSIRLDAAAVELRIDVLADLVRERQNEILGSVPTAISDLASARAALIDFLVARMRREVSADSTRPIDDGTAVGSTDRTSAVAGVAVRRTLEARLMEAEAAVDQLVSGAIERASRAILSRHAENLRRTELQLATTDGLAQVIDERLEIRTAAAIRLAELMRRMKGGSVGIAGARGAGKSTIIRRFHDGRERIGARPLLSVMVPAPVVYDSREFMLHLFAEVCRAAGARPPPPEPSDEAVEQPSGSALWALAAVRTQAWWFPVPALWVILWGIAAFALAVDEKLNDLIVWGGAVICAASVAWLVEWAELRRRLRRAAQDDMGGPPDDLRPGVSSLDWPLALVALVGAALVVAGLVGVEPSPAIARAVAVMVIGLILLEIAWNVQRGLRRIRPNRREEPVTDSRARRLDQWRNEWLSGDELVTAASLRLEELRYQQSYTVGVTGSVGLPLGIQVGASAGRTLARHPMTFPEVVGGLQRFLALAAKTHDVFVAVDELDKLEADDDTASRFLNDLKAAFGVANTYFLVSVSEDAMSRFERRGLPFRDVFDSTFDEIVRVEPLSLAEAQQLLSERVVGFPYIYSGLCHVLAGGIPRDLIRIARRIIEVNDRLGKPDTLGAIVVQLMIEDLQGKADAVEHATIALDAPDDWFTTMLEWVRGFRAASASRAALMSAATELHHSAAQFDATRELSDKEAVAQSALRRLTLELGTYGYFAATALDFFSDTLTESEIEAAANGTDPTLERLAHSRTAFAVSARTAWLGINKFRTGAGLQPASLPVPPLMGSAGPKVC